MQTSERASALAGSATEEVDDRGSHRVSDLRLVCCSC